MIVLLAGSAIWAAPVSATIKHRAPGGQSSRASSKTNTQSADDLFTHLKGSAEIEASWRTVEVIDMAPERGFVLGLAGFLIDPGNSREILASAGLDGVSKSADGGRNWHPANVGLTAFGRQAGIPNIRRDPSHPRTVYAVGEGLYRSTDFGERWSRLTSAFGLKDISVSPADPSVLFVVADGGLFYKSTDGVRHWFHKPASVCLRQTFI